MAESFLWWFLLLLTLLFHPEVVIHVLLGADKDGSPLMDGRRLDVQGRFFTAMGFPTSIFNHIGHGVTLV